MEIQVGEYVRTDNGLIGVVNKIELQGCGVRYAGEFITDEIIQFNDGNVYERRAKAKKIIKHSKNIIDLIEVGDYVNGKCIEQIQELQGEKCLFYDLEMPIEIDLHFLKERDIKTIVTKEQFELVEYKIEEVK